MNQSKILVNVLIVLILVGLLAFSYFFFFVGDDEVSISTTSLNNTTGISTETSEFLVLLQSLRAVNLSAEIFNNPVFANRLVNYTTNITPRPQGRSNPFAPLGTANIANFNSTADQVETEAGAEAEDGFNVEEVEAL